MLFKVVQCAIFLSVCNAVVHEGGTGSKMPDDQKTLGKYYFYYDTNGFQNEFKDLWLKNVDYVCENVTADRTWLTLNADIADARGSGAKCLLPDSGNAAGPLKDCFVREQTIRDAFDTQISNLTQLYNLMIDGEDDVTTKAGVTFSPAPASITGIGGTVGKSGYWEPGGVLTTPDINAFKNDHINLSIQVTGNTDLEPKAIEICGIFSYYIKKEARRRLADSKGRLKRRLLGGESLECERARDSCESGVSSYFHFPKGEEQIRMFGASHTNKMTTGCVTCYKAYSNAEGAGRRLIQQLVEGLGAEVSTLDLRVEEHVGGVETKAQETETVTMDACSYKAKFCA